MEMMDTPVVEQPVVVLEIEDEPAVVGQQVLSGLDLPGELLAMGSGGQTSAAATWTRRFAKRMRRFSTLKFTISKSRSSAGTAA
jgi:hypothetical protein